MKIRHLLAAAAVVVAAPVPAALDDAALPPGAAWYVHVDFAMMRETVVGQRLYRWLDAEVFDELRERSGFDPDRELDSISAYSDGGGVTTLILEGEISQDSRDKLLAALETGGDLSTGRADGRDYYEVRNVDMADHDIEIQGDSLFLSFDRRNALVVANTRDAMQRALETKLARPRGKALLVLTADKSLMQAGVDTMALGKDGRAWNSGLLREAREIAFVLADRNGEADITVRVTANDPKATDALAAVVRGLVGLQALAEDQDPDVSAMLSTLKIETDSAGMTLAMRVAPDVLAAVVED